MARKAKTTNPPAPDPNSAVEVRTRRRLSKKPEQPNQPEGLAGAGRSPSNGERIKAALAGLRRGIENDDAMRDRALRLSSIGVELKALDAVANILAIVDMAEAGRIINFVQAQFYERQRKDHAAMAAAERNQGIGSMQAESAGQSNEVTRRAI